MKHACYVGTRNMYPLMLTSMKSLIANSDVDKVHCLIEDDCFPFDVPEGIVEPINVSESHKLYFKPGGPNYALKWTYMTLLRAALPFIFPDIDLMLSLDDDTIVVDNISDVWDLPVRYCHFAASKEPLKSMGGEDYKFDLYTQMGVVLYNLKKLRNDGMAEKVIQALNAFWFDIAEQDCFNMFCQGTIYPMPCEYNQTNYTECSHHPKIMHYAFVKEEHFTQYREYKHYQNMTWDEVFHERQKTLSDSQPTPALHQ